MSVWFEGESEIETTIQYVGDSLADHGKHFVEVVRLMPGLTSVELLEQGSDFVIIRTNEGLMERTNVAKRIEADTVVFEFDENYQAGSKVTAKGHFVDQFTTSGSGVKHRLVISEVEAPGILGFFYRRFGSSKTGNAFLNAYKAYLEGEATSE